MTLTAVFTEDATNARVTLAVTGAPAGTTTAHLQRSTDLVTWTDVRGAQAVAVTGGAATFLDYEYAAGQINHYRAIYDATFATYVGAGAAATANNGNVQPGLPAAIATGDLKVAFVSIRSATGTGRITTPPGWTPVLGTPAGVNLFTETQTQFAGPPTFTFTGGAAGDDCIAQIAAFRGVQPTVAQSASVSNSSAQNVAFPGLTIAAAGIAVLAGWKQAVSTSSSGPAAMTQIGSTSSALGSGASEMWFEQAVVAGQVFGAGSITVSGGTAAVSEGITMALAGVAQDTATVTPNQAAVWLKNPLRPFLNRAVTVVDIDDITRATRSALFDVIGRTLPVARTDLMSGRSTTLTLRVTSRVDADDLDGMLAVGEVLLVQAPAPGSPVPTMYALPGGVTRQRVAQTSAVRRFPLAVTECAMPDLTLAAVQSTWVTVTNTYATWADLVAAKATWADVLLLVGTAADVVTS